MANLLSFEPPRELQPFAPRKEHAHWLVPILPASLIPPFADLALVVIESVAGFPIGVAARKRS